jgi:diguanylate cyclase (GGDEF)-like protein/PAS domain S-box-containing protein
MNDEPRSALSSPPVDATPARSVLPRASLLVKFVAYIAVLGVLPLLVLGLTSFEVSQSVVDRLAGRYSVALLEAERDYLDLQLEQVESLIASLVSVDDILDAVSSEQVETDSYTRLATQAKIGYILSNYLYVKGLVSIDLLAANGSYYHVGDTLDAAPPALARQADILDTLSAAGDRTYWFGIVENPNARSPDRLVITAGRAVWRTDRKTVTRRAVASILVNFDVNQLYRQFVVSSLGVGSHLMVVDGQRRIVYHPDRALIGQPVAPEITAALTDVPTTIEMTLGGVPTLVTAVRSNQADWWVLALIPLKTITAETSGIALATTVALLICLAFVVATGYALSQTVVTPLKRITERFQRFQAGDPAALQPVPVTGRDEIAELSRWFNTFVQTADERRRSDRALRDSEERYALAIRGANDSLWDWDLRTNRLYLSPRWKTMLGFREEDVRESPSIWFDRIHPNDRGAVLAAVEDHLSGRSPHFEIEHRLLAADGTYLWMLVRGLAVRDEHGVPYRMAGSHSDITARKRAEEQLRHDALHDVLTGLANRRALFDAVERTLATCRAEGRLVGLLMFDLDHFKDINDTLGHEKGDMLLAAVADEVKTLVRDGDQVARLGGDEFAVLCPDIADAGALAEIANRLVMRLRQPLAVGADQFTTTVSIGLAMSSDAATTEDLVREADLALYEAKRGGRNRYCFFDEELERQARDRLAVETILRQESAEGALFLLFQPQLDARTRTVRRLEALARWRTADGTILRPNHFVPAAERSGMIHEITRLVVQRALEAVAVIDAAGGGDIGVSINLSAIDLEHADLFDQLTGLIAAHGVAPCRIEFEITEGVLLRSSPTVMENIRRLGNAGCRFALDDFGTGFSSLSYLRQFPINTIKIDKSFVDGIGSDREDEELTRVIIALGHTMSKLVVAEGVETKIQADFLTSQGCDMLQGFLFARPMPLSDVESSIRERTPT